MDCALICLVKVVNHQCDENNHGITADDIRVAVVDRDSEWLFLLAKKLSDSLDDILKTTINENAGECSLLLM